MDRVLPVYGGEMMLTKVGKPGKRDSNPECSDFVVCQSSVRVSNQFAVKRSVPGNLQRQMIFLQKSPYFKVFHG